MRVLYVNFGMGLDTTTCLLESSGCVRLEEGLCFYMPAIFRLQTDLASTAACGITRVAATFVTFVAELWLSVYGLQFLKQKLSQHGLDELDHSDLEKEA